MSLPVRMKLRKHDSMGSLSVHDLIVAAETVVSVRWLRTNTTSCGVGTDVGWSGNGK